MFTFLRAIGLSPLEWSQAISFAPDSTPYIGEVLNVALKAAQAVLVLLTPDDVAYLRPDYAGEHDDDEKTPCGQARPNVLFEAGMAMGHDSGRTVLVQLGKLRAFSDVAGRHILRLTGSVSSRQQLAQRMAKAGCAVDISGTEWHTAGEFAIPQPVSASDLALAPGHSAPEATTADDDQILSFSKVKIAPSVFGNTEVMGQITNNDDMEHSAAIRATVYTEDGEIRTTATGAINQLAARQTKTFSILIAERIGPDAEIIMQTDTLL
jgi:hypothetical protein